jgi:hypothetical protein
MSISLVDHSTYYEVTVTDPEYTQMLKILTEWTEARFADEVTRTIGLCYDNARNEHLSRVTDDMLQLTPSELAEVEALIASLLV